VREFDVQNEIDLQQIPIRARLIVDHSHPDGNGNDEDVLGQIRGRTAQVFPAPPGNPDPNQIPSNWVTYSATTDVTSQAGFDCASIYGDSARMHGASQLLGALGYSYGAFGFWDGTPTNGLTCVNSGSSTADMGALSILHSPPAILDVHTAPCVMVGSDCDSDATNVEGESEIQFTDLMAFLQSFGNNVPYPYNWRCCYNAAFADALAMVGETHGHSVSGCLNNNGLLWNTADIPCMVSGFNDSNNLPADQDGHIASRILPGGGPSVVFRPWEYLLNQPSGGADPVKCNPIVVNTVDSHLTPAQ